MVVSGTCRHVHYYMKGKDMKIPEKVQFIIESLEQYGYEAYAVGGCVRDSLLGRIPGDWDITTSAKPQQVKQVFSRTIDTGIQHGTVTVMLGREGFEVTTYRIDGSYSDGRHPDQVAFTSQLKEDLRRRDFTINAMAYNPRTGIVDLFGGQEDLQQKIIRCVGNPRERFLEDALRILRAVRFSAQLGFSIETDTGSAIQELAGNLSKISKERIQAEMVKLLVSPHPEELRTAYTLGITKVILPEFDVMMSQEQNTKYHCYSVGEHTIQVICHSPGEKVLRLAALFHDFGKPAAHTRSSEGIDSFKGHAAISAKMARERMRDWKFDNDTIDLVEILVQYHDVRMEPVKKNVRRLLSKIGAERMPLLLDLQRADAMGKAEWMRSRTLSVIDAIEQLYREILEEEECFSLKQLAVDGKMLIQAGMKPGRALGEVLQQMLDYVIEHPECNNADVLLQTFSEMIWKTEKEEGIGG